MEMRRSPHKTISRHICEALIDANRCESGNSTLFKACIAISYELPETN
jgi:hypothetical protein